MIQHLMPHVKDAYACELLDQLLVLDPSRHCESDVAMNHAFFWTDSLPSELSKMLAQHA
jgi:hypothetical protein